MKRKLLAIILSLLTFSLAACSTSGNAGNSSSDAQESSTTNSGDQTSDTDSYTIKVGVIKAIGTVTPYVIQEKGLFEEKGVNVEFIEFSDGSALAEAFAAEGLDIGFLGIAPAATWQAKGVDYKVVASANGGGHIILTRDDTGIETTADLEGKIIATPNLGTVTDTLLRDYILPEAGLDPENDVQLLSGVKPGDMAVSLFDTQEVDAILTWEPFASQAEATYDNVKVVYDSPKEIQSATGEDALYAVNVVIASQDLIDEHSDDLSAFLDAYSEAVDFVNEDSSANTLIAEILELDESIVEASRKRVDYTYKLNIDSLERTLTWAKNLGYLEEIPARDELFDTSFIGE